MRLYNTESAPVVVGGWNNPAIAPGAGEDFDEKTATYLLSTGRWTEMDPRAGLEAEAAFKARRDNQTPAVPDDKGATQ